jgi:hypothetical protein
MPINIYCKYRANTFALKTLTVLGYQDYAIRAIFYWSHVSNGLWARCCNEVGGIIPVVQGNFVMCLVGLLQLVL